MRQPEINNEDTDATFMEAALKEAAAAASEGEIPVGAVIVRDGEILARGRNRNRSRQNAVLHAEIIAIQEASKITGNERLTGCDLYVTKEPCAMCAGAIVHARIRKVYIGTQDSKYGACGTALAVCGNPLLNHVPEIEFGLLGEQSRELLRVFFEALRQKR
jgi:tRNA(adenine34) deaminase